MGSLGRGNAQDLAQVRIHGLVLLLDTNALFSILSKPGALGKGTQRLIESTSEVYFSPLSVFEISMKHMLGKLRLRHPLGELLAKHQFSSFPLRTEDALEVYSLSSLTRHDPFDRLILATAKTRGARLVTSDRKMLELGFDWILDSNI
jgi:PIN domain nuclease of toxin-antitoxin system